MACGLVALIVTGGVEPLLSERGRWTLWRRPAISCLLCSAAGTLWRAHLYDLRRRYRLFGVGLWPLPPRLADRNRRHQD